MNRICKKCGETKDITLFVKDKRCLHGYTYTCNSCNLEKIRSKKNNDENYRKHLNNLVKQSKDRNKEKVREYNKAYKLANKDQIKTYNRNHYLKNRTEIIEQQKLKYKRKKEKQIEFNLILEIELKKIQSDKNAN